MLFTAYHFYDAKQQSDNNANKYKEPKSPRRTSIKKRTLPKCHLRHISFANTKATGKAKRIPSIIHGNAEVNEIPLTVSTRKRIKPALDTILADK